MTTDRVAGISLALFAAILLEETWRVRLPLGSVAMPGPAYVPVVLAVALLVSGTVIAVQGRAAPSLATVGWHEWRHAAAICAVCAFMALAFERLGYRITVAAACVLLLMLVERKAAVPAVIFGASMAFGTYYLFDTLLRVQLPRGPFGF